MTAPNPNRGRLSGLGRRAVWWYLNVDRILGTRHVATVTLLIAPTAVYASTVGFSGEVTPAVLLFSHAVAAGLGWASGWL